MAGGKVFKSSDGCWNVEASIEIDASPEQVWAELVDGEGVAEWASRAVVWHDGNVVDGETLALRFKLLPGPIATKLNRTVEVEDAVQLRWHGSYGPGMADDHVFRLDPLDGGERTRFTQSDKGMGALGRPLGRLMMTIHRTGYATWNKQFKARVEASNG